MDATRFTPHFREGAGEPLVLVHGVTSFWETWIPIIERVGDGYDVFAPTLPGHAGSSVPLERPANVGTLTDALETMLDEQGIGTAHLVGSSLGGWLAVELARRGRARSVLALAPAGGWPSGVERRGPRLFRLVHNLMRATRPAAPALVRSDTMRRASMALFARRGDHLVGEEMLRAIDAALEFPVSAVGELCRECVSPCPDPGVPMLIAWSAADRMLPKRRYRQRFEAAVSWADVLELPDVGHLPWVDDPDLVARAVGDWLTSCRTQSPKAVKENLD